MNDKCSNLRAKIALKIKLERTKRNISQESLALSAGLNKNTIGKIERAEISPTVETLEKIAIALEVSFFDLVNVTKFCI